MMMARSVSQSQIGRIKCGDLLDAAGASPDPRRVLLRLNPSRRAGEDRAFRGGDRLGRAHMHPHAFEPQAVEPACVDGTIEQEVERKRPVGRPSEQGRGQDRDAGIDERRHLALAAAAQAAVRGHGEIAAAGIADAARRRREEEQRIHPRRVEALGETNQVGLHAVDPDGVGVEMIERRRAEGGQRLDHAAAGVEQARAFVGNDDARHPPSGKVTLDLIGEVMNVDDGGVDAGRGQAIEHVVEQRLAADSDERLGRAIGERPHANAVAGRQDHGAARNRGSESARHCHLERIK
jgi:hypothetical protein